MELLEECSMFYILKFLPRLFMAQLYDNCIILVKDQNKDCLNVMPEINTPPHTYTYMF